MTDHDGSARRIVELRSAAGLDSATQEVLAYWKTFESRYADRIDSIAILLEELVSRNATIGDLYTVCRYSNSDHIQYNLECLDFMRSVHGAVALAELPQEVWREMYSALVCRRSGGEFFLQPISSRDPRLKCILRFLGEYQALVFDENVWVVGSRAFLARIVSALELLRERAPEEYRVVLEQIGQISEWPTAGMAPERFPPTYLMDLSAAYRSLTWCASCIVHEAQHGAMYRNHLRAHQILPVPYAVYSGVDAELQCIEVQMRTAERIGAPEAEIEYLRGLDGTHCAPPQSKHACNDHG